MVKRLQLRGAGCTKDPVRPIIPANKNPLEEDNLQLVHIYSDVLASPDVSFVVASALASKEDWSRLRVLLWLPPSVYNEWMKQPPPFWIDCPRHVTVLEYNMTREASDTVLEDRVAVGLPGKLAYNMAYTTDAVRLILLYKYGGLWVDTDSMFVMDYDDLFHIEFPGYIYGAGANGAMMHFYKRGPAISHMINEAAASNRYGPFDGFKGLKKEFWKEYNANDTKTEGVKIQEKEAFELPDCFIVECGLRKRCRFFDDLNSLNETQHNHVEWYNAPYFGVNDVKHRIVHTHNQCKKDDRRYHENSMFRVLLYMYQQVIAQYPYCDL